MTTPLEETALQQAHRLIDEGNRLEAAGRLQEARVRYFEARDLAPDLPRGHLNVGNVLRLLGDQEGAIAAYEAALARDANFAPAYFNLGNLYLAARQLLPAIENYRRALAVRPNFADAEVGLGGAHYQLGQWDAAAAAYARALALRPDYAPVYLNLGNVLTLQRKFPEALLALREAVRLMPGDGASRVTAYYVSLHVCDWSQRRQDEDALVEMIAGRNPGASTIPLAVLNIDRPGEPAGPLQRLVGEQFARNRLAGSDPAGPGPSSRAEKQKSRLRIGYLSADVYEHPVMHLLKGVLAAHDRTRHAIHVYSYGITRDAMTTQVSGSVDGFRDLSTLSDHQAADVIAADDVDILVDLQGFTENVRVGIAARRPAPVLVNWLGYPATLGHPALADYLIGDPVVTPVAAAADFSENLALLPHCYLPNDRGRSVSPAPTREAAGLPPEGFVFCNFNQSFKFSPVMFDLWCRLLRELPDSVLWLRDASEGVKDNIRREAAARGIGAGRLVFAPRVPSNADHLGRLSLADLALDTFPYTSHTTACDALWVGVPLVTMRGSTFTSRVAASVLQAAGLPELVTTSPESCYALALALARDAASRGQLRARLLATRMDAPLFDTPRFTQNLEDLFARIWEQYRQGRREVLPARDRVARGP